MKFGLLYEYISNQCWLQKKIQQNRKTHQSYQYSKEEMKLKLRTNSAYEIYARILNKRLYTIVETVLLEEQ